ncbi:thioesterase family protein [Cupriavidus cauae]|uniref:thioesterase family protein n=1 Tax=Cupriavidus cauae TaxID=2608999 RepID=UPI002243EE55|nr:thioesterase family protein [Cupriavidus cauae]UZN49760.1 thioesterase family protein [Cupriavidus cauae]
MASQNELDPHSVFAYVGNRILPTALARGPWSPDAQHGGAPAGLLAAIAERAMADEPGWSMVRLTLELLRPVPIAPLQATHEIQPGGSVRRVALSLMHEDKPVVRGVAVFMRERAVDLSPAAAACPLPLPDRCSEPIRIPGMVEQTSFHYTAMESRVAAGSVAEPGPAAAWFRLAVPLIDGWPTPPSARAMAAADFGNGISWALPLDRFVFANADLTVSLHRQPQGEWVGVDSVTVAQPSGIGLTTSTLYDEAGAIGVAQQSLLIKQR